MYRDSPLQTGRLSLCSAADCAKHIEYIVNRTIYIPNRTQRVPHAGPNRGGAADFPCLRQLPPPPEKE